MDPRLNDAIGVSTLPPNGRPEVGPARTAVDTTDTLVATHEDGRPPGMISPGAGTASDRADASAAGGGARSLWARIRPWRRRPMAEPEQPASRTVVAFADARFGAVLTHREDAHGQLADVQLELHHPPPLGPEALAVLIRCELLRVRARRFLGTNNLTATLAVISGVLVGFLRSLPAPAKDRTSRVRLALAALLHSELAGGLASAPQGPPAASLAVLNDGIQKGEKFYEQMVQRKVRIDYLIGVGIGILVVGGAVALSAVLLPSTVGGEPKAQVAGALGAGLIGGVVSVMSRALSGQIVLDRELGGFWLNTVGAVRPAIGALFGLVLYFFLQAGLVPINPNATPTHLFFFTSAVAFAAGFSERLVPDLINRLESKV